MKASTIVLAGLIAIPAMGAGAACSPAADPIGKGNAHFGIEFSPTAPAENSCGLPSIGGIGSPEPPEMPVGTTASSNFGQEVTDGQSIDEGTGSYVVKCTVTSGGSIDIEMEGPNTSRSAGATNQGTTSIRVEGSIDTDDGTGTAKITARTPFSGSTASTDCDLFAVENSDGEFALGAGEARFTFVCEQAKTALDEFGICQTRGIVSVRDCLEE